MDEEQETTLNLADLSDFLDPTTSAGNYAIFLKIKRILELLDSRLSDLDGK